MNHQVRLRKLVLPLLLVLGAVLALAWMGRGAATSGPGDPEAAWRRVGELAAGAEPGVSAPLEDLLASWDSGSSPPVEAQVEGLLDLLEAYPECTLAPGTQPLGLVQATDAALHSEELAGRDLLTLVRLAGRLRGSGDLLQFATGAHILSAALERCRQEPDLLEVLSEVEAPRADELFRAVCRDALHSPAVAPSEEQPAGSGEEVVRDAARFALADLVLRLEPRRDDPASWSELAPPAAPGPLRAWWARQVGDPKVLAAELAPLVWPTLDGLAGTWVAVLDRWDELTSPGEAR